MPSRISSQCTTRRKHSLGKLRRAHPASGATWNVQVVRGKMSSQCLWHACRALVLGMLLMTLGAGMATVGYYADQLSIGSEVRGNSTVRVKNESKGFHLNNLSYVGPIVMGFGGFIVVASCVMTFEARDSAAKVVPARLKATASSKTNIKSHLSSTASQRRANGPSFQNARWDHHLGVYKSSPAEHQEVAQLDRHELTAALIHFSKTLGHTTTRQGKQKWLSRSGSVPILAANTSGETNITTLSHLLSPNREFMNVNHNSNRRHRHHHRHTYAIHQGNCRYLKPHSPKLCTSLLQRTSRDSVSSLLQPTTFQKQYWNALSFDATDSEPAKKVDQNKRSDIAKRYLLCRQKPIENQEMQHTDMEERRSQLSICSEPITVRQLSIQSSIEPCVLEESPETDGNCAVTHHDDTLRGILTNPKLDTPQIGTESTNIIKDHNSCTEKTLHRSNSSLNFYRPKPKITSEDDALSSRKATTMF